MQKYYKLFTIFLISLNYKMLIYFYDIFSFLCILDKIEHAFWTPSLLSCPCSFIVNTTKRCETFFWKRTRSFLSFWHKDTTLFCRGSLHGWWHHLLKEVTSHFLGFFIFTAKLMSLPVKCFTHGRRRGAWH